MYDRVNKHNQIRQKDKSFSNLKRWESTLVSCHMIILMIKRPYRNSSSKCILIAKKRSYELLKWLNQEDESYFVPIQVLESYSKIVTWVTCLKEGLKHLSNVRVKVFYSCTFEISKLWCFGSNKDQLRLIVLSVCLD